MRFIILAMFLVSCGQYESTSQLTSDVHKGSWRGVIMSGDDSIRAFDNARTKVGQILNTLGLSDVKYLSANKTLQKDGVLASNEVNLEKQIGKAGELDSCLLILTSHGSRSGFYIKGERTLTPKALGGILDRTCGDRPTVMLVSSCYSGVQIDPATIRKNRIVLTAARRDRTSFGCGVEDIYTYYDTCLISLLPAAKTWAGLQETMLACIEKKEGNGARSYPQSFFGDDVKDLAVSF